MNNLLKVSALALVFATTLASCETKTAETTETTNVEVPATDATTMTMDSTSTTTTVMADSTMAAPAATTTEASTTTTTTEQK
ncbi:hypothetical protein [Hymenobacter elongatus]|uniref:Coproporphyrinogen III oxidase n=1 Tax=Hymenobacter elongatus TaxID=877208 RepID=A0A4Z0PQZ4_9BACT|nr:hypothetical protein [Hymenobacter elongatus]TGE19736.1 hypothetical protein E5J99_02955 [Hymenobacter elongatus]